MMMIKASKGQKELYRLCLLSSILVIYYSQLFIFSLFLIQRIPIMIVESIEVSSCSKRLIDMNEQIEGNRNPRC
jgi:hypothetical protein